MADPEDINAIIRSILTSTTKDTTIDDLWREFEKCEGRPFPYAALGCKSFWDYLKSIPDIVKLEQVKGGSTFVRLIASKKSAHIEKFVMCQKVSVPSRNSSRKGSSRRRRAAIVKPPDKYHAVKNIPSLLDYKCVVSSKSNSSSSSRALTPVMRDSESSDSKVSINQEIYSSYEDIAIGVDDVQCESSSDPIGRKVVLKNGVEKTTYELSEGISTFSNNKSCNSDIALNSGAHGLAGFPTDYSNLWPNLITSPAEPETAYNRIQIGGSYSILRKEDIHKSGPRHERMVYEIRYRNVHSCVITIKIDSNLFIHNGLYNKIIIPNEVVEKLLILLENSYEGMSIRDVGKNLKLSQKVIDRLCDLNINGVDDILRNLDDCVTVVGDRVFQKNVVSSIPNGVTRVPCKSDCKYNGSITYTLNGRNSVCSDGSECLINDKVVKNLKVLLQENSRGVFCDDLPQKYYEKYDSTLEPDDFGFNNVLDMASYLQKQTNEFILKKDINRNGWVLSYLVDVDIPVSHSFDENNSSLSLETGIIINRFKKILLKHQPLSSHDLLAKYNGFYGKESGIQSLGYKSIDEFINTKLKDIVDIMPYRKAQYISLKSDICSSAALPEAEEINDIMYSKDVCKLGDKLHSFQLSSMGDLLPTKLEFIVSDVTNPHCLSMQLVSSQAPLDTLMTNLYFFYEENEANYPICEEMINIDMLCACTFQTEEDWHRARIMDVSSDSVMLEYVDYGTTCNQPKSKLRLLHKQFLELPVQSIGAKLRGIRPPGNNFQWSDNVKNKLQQMFESCTVTAEIFKIDKKQFLEVNLIHIGPNGEETLTVDILVRLGLAEYTDLPAINKEFSNVHWTVPTKRSHRNSKTTHRKTRDSESSSKYSTGDEHNELRQGLYSEPPPDCLRPPPGFADTNREQNLLSSRCLINLTQTWNVMLNSNGVPNDEMPITSNETLLLCQPLSECAMCKSVYTNRTIPQDLLTILVHHNIRHVQVFYETLRQNLMLRMNPAIAEMCNMINSLTGTGSALLPIPGVQNFSVNHNGFATFPMQLPQTVNNIQINKSNSLPVIPSVLPNNLLQSLSHVNLDRTDGTLQGIDSIDILSALNTSVELANPLATLPNSNDMVSDVLCPSNTSMKLTERTTTNSHVGNNKESAFQLGTTETRVVNSSSGLMSKVNNLGISENSGSSSVTVSKSLLNIDFIKPVTVISTQKVNTNVKEQCVLKPPIEGNMTAAVTHSTDTSSLKHMPNEVNTVQNNKSVFSTESQISIVPQSSDPAIPKMNDTLEATSKYKDHEVPVSRQCAFSYLQQRNLKSAPLTSLHTTGTLMETSETEVNSKRVFTVLNEYHDLSADHQLEISIHNENSCVSEDSNSSNTSSVNLERVSESCTGNLTDMTTADALKKIPGVSYWKKPFNFHNVTNITNGNEH